MEYDQIVDAGIARILGSRPSADPVVIINQLTAGFEKQTRNGIDYYIPRPRGTTALDSPLGGQVIGGQATIYQYVKNIQESANRLLDAVEPLLLEPDEEEIQILKEEIKVSLTNIVAEFGRVGGALIPRVEVLWETIRRDISDLRDALGMTQPIKSLRDIDLAEIEQNSRNFDLLEGYLIIQLRNAFGLYKKDVDNFKGTKLTQILSIAEAITDTVREVYAVMDSVKFGPVDRRVTVTGGGTTTIEQLLQWIETSASTDWPKSLVGGGARRSEVEAVWREAISQKEGVDKLIKEVGGIISIRASRVELKLRELLRELEEVETRAEKIK
jgi:hypothetical protein